MLDDHKQDQDQEVEVEEKQDGQIGEETPPEQADDAEPPTGEKDGEGEDEKEQVVISYGDQEQPVDVDEDPGPLWARELRQRYSKMKSENHQLREKLKQIEKPQQSIDPGPMPTIEQCEYDEVEFGKKMAAWQREKILQEHEQKQQQARQQQAQQRFSDRLKRYAEKRKIISQSLHDYDDAEDRVQSRFDVTKQGIIVQGADDPALVIYAIGKNPEKAKALAQIDNPIDFAFAVAKMESNLKLGKRKKPPQPEKKITRTGSTAGAFDSRLEELRKQAMKSGDYTKVNAYKKARRK